MKTPEELAEEYVQETYKFRSPNDWVEKNAFLAGYEAGVQSSHAQIKELQKLVRECQEELKARDRTIEDLQIELNAWIGVGR